MTAPPIPGELGIVGVGAIAEAIVTGLCEGEDRPPSIHLSPRSAARTERLAARYPSVQVVDSNQTVVERADVVLVCVRPQDAQAALSDLTFREEQAVISMMAGISIAALGALVAPAEVLVRAIPLPAVARREGLTAIHPPHELARAIFDPLGGVIAVDDERALDALSASTATLAAHLAYLDTITRWLVDRGIPEADATRYVSAVFGALSGTLLATPPTDFSTLSDEYATAGGINEQLLAALRRAGTFDIVESALDDVAHRLEGQVTPAGNAELVRRLYAELASEGSAEDFERRMSDEALGRFLDPEIEWVPVSDSVQAVDSYRGFEGVRRFWGEFVSAWDSYRVELARLDDAGDQVAVVVHIVGRTHELEVDETRSSLLTVRDGRVVRVESFSDPEGARQAAGLPR